jgi:NADH-quinone oxidoreductase subunit N
MTSFETFALLSPEIVLIAAALVAYLGGAFAGLRHGWLIALVGIAAAMSVTGGQPSDGGAATAGPVSIDGFSTFIRWTVLGVGALLALVQAGDIFSGASSHGVGLRRGGTCEEAGTFLVMLAGLSLVGVAGDLVLLFAGLELVSIPTYVLLGLKRTDARGQEAALKYFFLSLIASAIFLYGAATLYGIAGTTSLGGIGVVLQSGDGIVSGMATVLLPVALGMTVVGTMFRLAAVPMHFYAPDVYEGTGPGNAAMLSTLPKLAGLVVLGRLLTIAITTEPAAPGGIGPAAHAWLDLFWQLTAVLAAVTMTVGNVMALWQKNLRRLFACSSIAHAGYLLVGVAAAGAAAATHAELPLGDVAMADAQWTLGLGGMTAAIFYLATYVLPTIGIFGALAYLGHRWPEWTTSSGPRPPREEIAAVDDLDGLSSTNPVAAFAIALFTLSLAGIPPLPGFWGKLTLAASALEVDWNAAITSGSRRALFVSLAVILAVNAAIAAAYYLRIIAAMYFKTTKRGVQSDGGLAGGLAMLACLVLVFFVTIQPRGLLTASTRAGRSLTTPVVKAPSSGSSRLAGAGFTEPAPRLADRETGERHP